MASYEQSIYELVQSVKTQMRAQPLNLGGSSVGNGGPPGGFIGYLPQRRVAYDPDEISSSGISISGYSLLDNLNHIRNRITTLESSSGTGGGGHTISVNNTVVPNRGILDFSSFLGNQQIDVTDSAFYNTTYIELKSPILTDLNTDTPYYCMDLQISGNVSVSSLVDGTVRVDILSSSGTFTQDCSMWVADAKPVSSNSMDDEFSDSTFDSVKWTEMDISSGLTITEDVVGLKLINSSYAEISTITQSVPITDYTVWTKVSIYGGTYDGWGRAGLVFQEGDETQQFYTVGHKITEASNQGLIPMDDNYWTDYVTYNTAGSLSGKYFPGTAYIRTRVDVTLGEYSTDYSIDGLSWQSAGTTILTFTPTKVGLFKFNADQADTAVYSFFRITASKDINQTMNGNRVAVKYA